jgi:hypothetical protein
MGQIPVRSAWGVREADLAAPRRSLLAAGAAAADDAAAAAERFRPVVAGKAEGSAR